ncbi:MAG: rhamnose ABC transporter substrate-binding protein [Treponema sp.]|nr:rhamnose ABC transporter substrate-binding protein [Treponema sp.]
MKKVITLLLLAALLFAVVGCRRDAQEGAHAMIAKSTGNPYMDRMLSGFEDAITAQGGIAITRAPALPTAEGQIQIIDQLIAQRVASIGIAANDFDALEPALARAMNQGIKVYSLDSAVNPASRNVHVNQADTQAIGRTLIEAVYYLTGGAGEFAILSATSTASNQNAWIAVMQEVLTEPQFSNLDLVRIVFGDDLRDRSTSEAQALLASFPDLRVIVAPTTVGIAAAARVVTTQGLIGQVYVTGLGLPSEMAEYIENGSCPFMFLWNPIDLGYLSGYVATALANGTIDGEIGGTLYGGRLGSFTVTAAGDGGTEILLGAPFRFDPDNIAVWRYVY